MAVHSHDPVLITGCSTGIGRSIAFDLLRRGHTVVATARGPQTLAALAEAGAQTLALDVTDEASMTTAVEQILADHGRIGSLVNNAGFGVYGPIEETDLDRVRAMFDTNVFGLVRLCRLVLPSMRAHGDGRIVNMGSMGGKLVFPVGGYYHATKYAVEAISDAMRMEVRDFGIRVTLIEPGPIRSNFEATILDSVADHPAGSAYSAQVDKAADVYATAYGNRFFARGPAVVVRAVRHAIESQRPRSRYLLTGPVKLLVAARRLGGDRVWDAVAGRQFAG